MGFLGPVPASELAAVYDPAKQALTLSASGNAQNFTYGFFFKRTPWEGGLRFELWGWTGPIGEGTSPFSYSQTFTIPNILLNDSSNTVVVVTANNPSGKVINIHWTGLKPGSVGADGQGKVAANGEKQPAPPQIVDTSSPLTINTLYREPFNISEKISTGRGATLHADFDAQMLQLTATGVDDGSLHWTFNSLQTGLTQVVTYSTAGYGEPVIRKAYSVKIFVLDAAAAAGPAAAADSSTSTATTTVSKGGFLAAFSSSSSNNNNNNSNGSKHPHDPDAILSFLGRVNEAQRIAQRVLKSARLLRVEATKPAGPVFPVTDPMLLSQLDVLFVGDDGKYVVVQSTGWGEWAVPEVKEGVPPLGIETFDLDSVKVDIVQAAKAIQAGGDEMAFWKVTLVQPFGSPSSGPYQPLYNFRMVDASIVAVNAVTGKVMGK